MASLDGWVFTHGENALPVLKLLQIVYSEHLGENRPELDEKEKTFDFEVENASFEDAVVIAKTTKHILDQYQVSEYSFEVAGTEKMHEQFSEGPYSVFEIKVDENSVQIRRNEFEFDGEEDDESDLTDWDEFDDLEMDALETLRKMPFIPIDQYLSKNGISENSVLIDMDIIDEAADDIKNALS